MDKDTRTAIDRATQKARRLLEDDFAEQLEGDFDVLTSGEWKPKPSAHLKPRQVYARDKIVAAIEHKRASGLKPEEAVRDYRRDAAFTTLNRFVALKMLEARELVLPCITKGEQSSGYVEFCGMAPGVNLLPDSQGYRLYLESIFDELSTEVKVLFDRRDPASVLWPKRVTFTALLELLNAPELVSVWGEDETIGWVYQYFNSLEERQAMKDTKAGGSQAPRNSRELATRNQFFTPRYIVRFLGDNTLGRLWWEMRGGDTSLRDQCELLTTKPNDVPPARVKKDPRDLRIIDPACGSGHFLLYVFDLLVVIYDEAWSDPSSPASVITGRSLRGDYPTLEALRAAAPELIVEHNLYGVDIDSRCVQVASFALWLRAQRAWSEQKLPRGGRARIERSHVILAEPMSGDVTLVAEFSAQLGHPVLADLFQKVVAAFQLAGDLGILLRVERLLGKAIGDAERATPRQSTLFGSAATSQAFWDTAEARLLLALEQFAASGEGRTLERRRLFRHDAANGLSLLDAARTQFDVVLMNPPFGDPSGPSKKYIDDNYDDSRQDLFAVFVERSVRDLAQNGFVGILSTEAGFFRRTLEPWRRNVLLAYTGMESFVHLGDNILDAAKVRVAAYALRTPAGPSGNIYVRAFLGSRESREPTLRQAVSCVREGRSHSSVSIAPQADFKALPYGVFGYWFSQELRNVFTRCRPLEPAVAHARRGMSTGDDGRYLRLRWETPSAQREAGWEWRPFAKGGEYSPYCDDIHLVCQWDVRKNTLAGYIGRPGRSGALPEAVDYYFRPGLTYPRRTNKRFAPRILPAGCALGDKGPAIVDVQGSTWALAAVLNSRVVGYLVSVGTGVAEATDVSNSYEVGLIQRLPVADGATQDPALITLGESAWRVRAESSLRDETAFAFESPAAPFTFSSTVRETWERLAALVTELLSQYIHVQTAIDARVCELYGLTAADWKEIEADVGSVHRPVAEVDDRASKRWVESLVGFFVGCAFGRWSSARLRRTSEMSADVAFAVPTAHVDEVTGRPAFLVDDPRHPLDIVRRFEDALAEVAPDRASSLMSEICHCLGVADLRDYLRAQFFGSHLAAYTKSKRSAPIYLPLSIPSGQYVAWLYLHRIEQNTLFDVQEELERKILLEDGRAAAMRGEVSTSTGRKAFAAQETFVEELRGMLDEVKRVKPLWRPDLDDGVIINFAPLWRLVPHHKPWQKELKATWDALCAGEYDWAHLAMHLWPERAVPKCVADRSLAIAHGLEDVFWFEDTDGKWKPRPKPTRSVSELVAERTSAAVKAARDSLIGAPTPGGGGKARRKRVTALKRRR